MSKDRTEFYRRVDGVLNGRSLGWLGTQLEGHPGAGTVRSWLHGRASLKAYKAQNLAAVLLDLDPDCGLDAATIVALSEDAVRANRLVTQLGASVALGVGGLAYGDEPQRKSRGFTVDEWDVVAQAATTMTTAGDALTVASNALAEAAAAIALSVRELASLRRPDDV